MKHSHTDHNLESENILLALVLNISFVFIEIIGGIMSNSISIISDAIHDLGDSLTLLFTYILSKIANKESDYKYTFGYKRLLILGATINSVVLICGSLFIFINAFNRLLNPEEINAIIMFWLSIIGMVVNGVSVFKMKSSKSLMSKSVMLHLMEDLLGWVAVFISSILIMLFKIYFIDTLLSMLIAMFL